MDRLQRAHAGSLLFDAEQLSRGWSERSGAAADTRVSGHAGTLGGNRRTAQWPGAGLPSGIAGRPAGAANPNPAFFARWPQLHLLAQQELGLVPRTQELLSGAAFRLLQSGLAQFARLAFRLTDDKGSAAVAFG